MKFAKALKPPRASPIRGGAGVFDFTLTGVLADGGEFDSAQRVAANTGERDAAAQSHASPWPRPSAATMARR